MKYERFAGSSVVLALAASSVVGCVTEPPEPPPIFWVENHGDTDDDGRVNFWVGMEVDIFNSGSPVNCSCGLGLTGPDALLALVELEGVMITVTNTVTHESTLIPAFNSLLGNTTTTDALNELDPGNTWSGYSGLVDTFTTPTRGPDEVFKIWFEIEVASGGLSTLEQIDGTVAAGEANPDGTPVPDGDHFGFFQPNVIQAIPAPGALSILGLGGLAVARRRR